MQSENDTRDTSPAPTPSEPDASRVRTLQRRLDRADASALNDALAEARALTRQRRPRVVDLWAMVLRSSS